MVHAFVLIDAVPPRVAALAAELAELEGVAEVYSVAGHADLWRLSGSAATTSWPRW